MKTVTVDGKTCRFDSDNHKYIVDGEQIPGTTSVTGIVDKSNVLKWWAVNQARAFLKDEMEPGKKYDEVEINALAEDARTAHLKTSNQATTIGTVAHQFCEDFIRSKLNGQKEPDLPVNDKAKASAKQFLAWYGENEIVPLGSEQIVYHPQLEYAGTYDLIARVNGDLLVIDFKTSKGIYDTHYLQARAYMGAEEYRSDKELDGFGILRIPKDQAGFENEIVTESRELQKHWQGFLAARQLYRWQQKTD